MTTSLQVATARANELCSAGTSSCPVPPITDPLGKSWDQPARSDITFDGECALMSRRTFERLVNYSASDPSGVYPGKMWRRHDGIYDQRFIAAGGKPEWLLRWYGACERPECPGCDKYCSNHSRNILVVD